jgi:hypothetical protein
MAQLYVFLSAYVDTYTNVSLISVTKQECADVSELLLRVGRGVSRA